MAASVVAKVRRDGVITLTDGAANSITVNYTDGDFSADSLTGTAASDRVVIRSRGDVVGLRRGDSAIGSITFSVHMREFTNATAGVLLDFITGTSGATTLTSTGGAAFEQFVCDCALTVDGQDLVANSVATFAKVLFTADFSEGDPNKLSIKGEVYGGVTYTGQV